MTKLDKIMGEAREGRDNMRTYEELGFVKGRAFFSYLAAGYSHSVAKALAERPLEGERWERIQKEAEELIDEQNC